LTQEERQALEDKEMIMSEHYTDRQRVLQACPATVEAREGPFQRRKPPDVQKAALKLTEEIPYETACELFQELTGLPLSAHTAHEMAPAAAAGLGGGCRTQPAARAQAGPSRACPVEGFRCYLIGDDQIMQV
jgi:hypothetical protein